MTFFDMEQAVNEAQSTMQRADRLADSLARLLVGRLRKIGSGYILKQLKTELRDFDARTNTWND